ncbi:response regulator [Patescibacteria group bacterium]|nr:MAG: response regulator [Patescibacteria group bacterium]
MTEKIILVVDDDALVRRATERLLRREGYTVYTAEGLEQAIAYLNSQSLDLLVTDDNMPCHHDGVVLIAHLRAMGKDTPAILFSGFSLEEIREDCRKKGVSTAHITHFVQKTDPLLVVRLVRELLADSPPGTPEC